MQSKNIQILDNHKNPKSGRKKKKEFKFVELSKYVEIEHINFSFSFFDFVGNLFLISCLVYVYILVIIVHNEFPISF